MPGHGRAVEGDTGRQGEMDAFHADRVPNRIHTVHRVSAAALGCFLLLFGVLSFAAPVDFLATSGAVVFGLSTNGLLATVSVIVGAVLVVAASRSGPTASSTLVIFGGLFVISGVANAVVLDTALNIFAFRVSNVVFSLVVGAVLLTLGAYGRFTGRLPDTSPYHGHGHGQTPTAAGDMPDRPLDPQTARALADAERATTEHTATPRQTAGVVAAAAHRTEEDRSRAFAQATAAFDRELPQEGDERGTEGPPRLTERGAGRGIRRHFRRRRARVVSGVPNS
jgi:hypothetical protein